jgi:hypothetical protein
MNRRVLAGVPALLLVAALSSLAYAASSATELPTSAKARMEAGWTTPGGGGLEPLKSGVEYRAGRVLPSPLVTPTEAGWRGTQLVTYRRGQERYAWAVYARGYGQNAGRVAVVSGRSMASGPLETLRWPYQRGGKPYAGPPIQRWRIAGGVAYAVEGTHTGPLPLTLIGANPPELQIPPGTTGRFATLAVRGKTIAIIVGTRTEAWPDFLPHAERLLASLRFPKSTT